MQEVYPKIGDFCSSLARITRSAEQTGQMSHILVRAPPSGGNLTPGLCNLCIAELQCENQLFIVETFYTLLFR